MSASQQGGVHVPDPARPGPVENAPGHVAEQATVAAFGRFALESRDITATIERCVDAVAGLFGTQMGAVFRLTGPARFQVVHVRGAPGLEPGQEFPIPAEVLAVTRDADRPIRVTDWRVEAGLPMPAMVEAAGMVSALAVGVFVGGRPWGRLAVLDPQPHRFSEGQADFLQSMAHVLAAALERDRSEQAQAALAAFGRFALESRDIAATIEHAVDAATRVLEAPMGLVTRLLERPGRAVAVYAGGWWPWLPETSSRSSPGWCPSSRRPSRSSPRTGTAPPRSRTRRR